MKRLQRGMKSVFPIGLIVLTLLTVGGAWSLMRPAAWVSGECLHNWTFHTASGRFGVTEFDSSEGTHRTTFCVMAGRTLAVPLPLAVVLTMAIGAPPL